MFYSDNLFLLSVLARSCKDSAVAAADAYIIFLYFDLLDSSCFKNVFLRTMLPLLLICNGVLEFFSISFYVLVYCVCF